MKQLIWSSVNENCVRYVPLLSRYFEINEPVLVDEQNRPILFLTGNYFYKSGDNFYPILNNKTWFGDYYDSCGVLLLSAEEKSRLLKAVPANINAMNYNDSSTYLINQVLNIFADYATDYHRAIRPFEIDDSYSLTVGNFNKAYLDFYNQLRDDECRCEAILNASNSIIRVEPALFELLCEYGSSRELQYHILSLKVDSGILSMFSEGDWRIGQWEILHKEKQEELELIKKLSRNSQADEINEALKLYLKSRK